MKWICPDAQESWDRLVTMPWPSLVDGFQWYSWRLIEVRPVDLGVPVYAEAGAVKEWSLDGRQAARDLGVLLDRWPHLAGIVLDEPLAAARALGLRFEAVVERTRWVMEAARDLPVGLVEYLVPSELHQLQDFVAELGFRWVHLDVDLNWWGHWRRILWHRWLDTRHLVPLVQASGATGLVIWPSGPPQEPAPKRLARMQAFFRRTGLQDCVVQSWDGTPLETLLEAL